MNMSRNPQPDTADVIDRALKRRKAFADLETLAAVYHRARAAKPAEVPLWAIKPLANDTPDKVKRACRLLLDRVPETVEGFRGENMFQAVCDVRDIGVSERTCLELMLDWTEPAEPAWAPDELAAVIRNVYAYGHPRGAMC